MIIDQVDYDTIRDDDEQGIAVQSWDEHNWWVAARPTTEGPWREHDEGFRQFMVIEHTGISRERMEELVKTHWPAERCQHSYDCCGRTYSQGAVILHHDHHTALVRQRFIVNV